MNAFFILMILLLGSRTVYYIVFRFGDDFSIKNKEINNNHLIFIYIEELIFNFAVFYNLNLKKSNDKAFEDEINHAKDCRIHLCHPHIQAENSFS